MNSEKITELATYRIDYNFPKDWKTDKYTWIYCLDEKPKESQLDEEISELWDEVIRDCTNIKDTIIENIKEEIKKTLELNKDTIETIENMIEVVENILNEQWFKKISWIKKDSRNIIEVQPKKHLSVKIIGNKINVSSKKEN